MPGSLKGRLSRYDRQVWMLFAAEIVNVFGTSIIRTFLAIYMFQTMHIPMFWVGVALFVSSLTGVMFAYVGGSLADAYGRKKILVAGLLLQIVAYLLISVAIDASVPYFLFVIVLAVSSLIQGLYQTVPDVMIADVVEPGKRVEAYGLLRIGANLGWVIGPVLGGLLLIVMPFSWIFYISAITTSVYLLIANFELRETKSTRKADKLRFTDILSIFKDRPFLIYTLIAGLMIIPYQQLYTALAVYSSDVVGLDDFWVGMLFAMSGAMVVLFQYAISLKVREHRLTTALAFSTVVFAAGFLTLAVSTAFLAPFVCMFIATVAEMIWAPAGSTMQANLAPEDRRGRYFGFAGLFSSLGVALGPLTGGIMMDSFTDVMPLMWVLVTGMFLACGVAFLLLNRIVPEAANAPGKQQKIKEKMLEAPIKA
jgi:MFS family permease